MLKKYLLLSSLGLLPVLGLLPAQAQSSLGPQPQLGKPDDLGMISITSKHSVKNTADRLQQIMQKKGLKLFARIDHQANAQSVKLALRPTILLIFGNLTAGTKLMHENQTIGLDLPLKYLIWESGDHEVFISWNNAYYLANRHGIPSNFELLSTLSQNLFSMAKEAAEGK